MEQSSTLVEVHSWVSWRFLHLLVVLARLHQPLIDFVSYADGLGHYFASAPA